jgi:TolB-like protein
MQYRFGDYMLDVARRELRHGGEPVAIVPQVFDALAYLIQNRDRVVTKDDLLDSVWGGRVVSESTLASRINAARRAIGDTGQTQKFIRTSARKGIRFVADIVDTPSDALPNLEPPRGRPSIAVMPLHNLTGKGEDDYFVDGMVEEIVTGLSRVKWLFVISRNSTFIYKSRPIDVRTVGRELGVRYVLEGSVRRFGSQVRLTGQLSETETGASVWADRYDGEMGEVFALQDLLTARSLAPLNRIFER